MRYYCRSAEENFRQGVKQFAKDPKKAVECFSDSASEGHPDAAYWLALCCENRHGVQGDHWKRVELKDKRLGVAADGGNVEANYLIGSTHRQAVFFHGMHDLGGMTAEGLEPYDWHKREAEKFLSRSALAGHSEALFEWSQRHPLSKTPEEMRWIRVAAALGQENAQFHLGLALREEGDREAGLALITKAANQGQWSAVRVLAQHHREETRDWTQALRWSRFGAYIKAVSGHQLAQLLLDRGERRETLTWIVQDTEKADPP